MDFERLQSKLPVLWYNSVPMSRNDRSLGGEGPSQGIYIGWISTHQSGHLELRSEFSVEN